MKATVEISLYPLDSEYEKEVIRFIKKLELYDELTIYTNHMSTYIRGDLSDIMSIVGAELERVFQDVKHFSTIMKILPSDLDMSDGYIKF